MNVCKILLNDKFIYSKIDVINEANKTKYYATVNDKKIEVEKDNICRPTKLSAIGNTILYDNDIIHIRCDDKDIILRVKYYDGAMTVDNMNLYIDGLMFMDFNFKPYFIASEIINSSNSIKYVGNILLNNIKDISKEN